MPKLLAEFESEFYRTLGQSAAEYMPHVRFRARAGEPNWNTDTSRAGINEAKAEPIKKQQFMKDCRAGKGNCVDTA